MPKYRITEKAGRFVAGHRNTGVGTELDLLPHAAEYEINLGTLVPADEPEPADLAEPQAGSPGEPEGAAAAETSAGGGKRKRRQ